MIKKPQIGTCSWKYDSWRGIIYPEQGPVNYLKEYSHYYNTVEIDQWFWSLFKDDKIVLPKHSDVRAYAESVPDNFSFCIKVPNSITLTHHYNRDKTAPLQVNPYFLSVDLMQRFLDSIIGLSGHIGPLIFQFEYLNKKKVPYKAAFFDRFAAFSESLPRDFAYCFETRNPNFLNSDYFDFLSSHDLYHVFLHGYYMPPIFDLYRKYKSQIGDLTVIRLHGPNRQGIEKQTGNVWNKIVTPRDTELNQLGEMLSDLGNRAVRTFVYVNNHFEGSAPRTISKLKDILAVQ